MRKEGMRIATESRSIERKASSARASETAFRSCMSMMMPELLDYWDNNHDSHKSKNWNEGKEKHLGGEGISFQILEQTAENLCSGIHYSRGLEHSIIRM